MSTARERHGGSRVSFPDRLALRPWAFSSFAFDNPPSHSLPLPLAGGITGLDVSWKKAGQCSRCEITSGAAPDRVEGMSRADIAVITIVTDDVTFGPVIFATSNSERQ
jgi:hypothetical protein